MSGFKDAFKSDFASVSFDLEYLTPNGNTIQVRPMTGLERIEMKKITQDEKKGPVHAMAWLVIRCFHVEGDALFDDTDLDYLLNDIPGQELERMADVVLEASGLTDEAEDEIKN